VLQLRLPASRRSGHLPDLRRTRLGSRLARVDLLKPPALPADLASVGSAPSAAYDPRVIERFAEQLLAKADSVRVGSAVFGGIVGVLCGAVPLTPLESVWPIPGRFGVATMLIGAMLGVLLGYAVGEGRAFRLRVQAQMALFQLEIERKVEAAVSTLAKPAVAEEVPAARERPPVQLPPQQPLLRQPESADELPPLSPPVAL